LGEKRIRITPENIFEKDQYKSILNMLIEYQDEEFQGRKGLRPLHFRYALERGYKDSDKCQVKANVKRLKKFFGNRLDALAKTGCIVPNCIKSRQGLTKILNNLSRPPISAIVKESNKPEVRYYIKPAFRNEGARIQNIGIINNFSGQQIREFIDQEMGVKAVCYGFSENLYKSLNESELKEFRDGMGEIQSIHETLATLKSCKSWEIWEGKINDFINKTENFNIKETLESKHLVKEFRRNLFEKIMISVAFSHMLNQSPEENIAYSVNDFFTDKDAGRYGLKQYDIEEVKKFVHKNLDFFMYDASPSIVAISSFAAIDFPPLEKVKQDKN
jgi:hypothetical protein